MPDPVLNVVLPRFISLEIVETVLPSSFAIELIDCFSLNRVSIIILSSRVRCFLPAIAGSSFQPGYRY